MNREMIELYSDYLIASFGQTTATGLSRLLQGSIIHDSVTRFLNTETLSAKEQWQLVKPMIRQIETDHANTTGYLIFDDTIQPKPHSREDDTTKNKRLLAMFDMAVKNQVKFDYVLADSWFSAKDTFKHIRKAQKHFIFALKNNRLVSLTTDNHHKQPKVFTRIDETSMPDNTPVRGYLKDYSDDVLFLRRVFTNKDGSTGILYLVCSDLQCDADTLMTGYEKRWQVEVYHKSLKQNANLASSPAFSASARANHIFLAVFAVFKLECLKIKTKLNHFALRTKLLTSACQSAFAELKALKVA